MITDLLERIKSFNEHQELRHLDAIPKNTDPESYLLSHSLMIEEANEYLSACVDDDLIKVADALGDMFYVLWGIICKHGMQDVFFEKILSPICDSNETKFCKNREDALKSIKALYEETDLPHRYWEWKGNYVIVNSETCKISKGIHYKEPVIKF